MTKTNDPGKLQTAEAGSEYADADELRDIFEKLKDKKYMLDCGHKVTFGYFLANDITIRNGKRIEIICRECGY